jgi:outer membrane protein TolC
MRRGPSRWLAGVALLAGAVAIAPARAGAAETIKVTLKDALRMALQVSPEVREQLQGVEAARGKLDQANAAYFPQAEVMGVFGPSQRAKANDDCLTGANGVPGIGGKACTGIQTSDKKTSSPVNGVFGLATINLVQPLYTFGKLSGYKEAATKGVTVELARVEERKSDIILRVKELYYSHLLALEGQGLLSDLKEQLEKALDKVQKSLDSESPTADQVDLYKLRSFMGDLEKYLNEANKGVDLSREALATYLGLAGGQRVALDRETLEPEVRQVAGTDTQVSDALRLRPEMAQVKAGLDARRALVDVERSEYYPQFFAAIVGAWSGATNRSFIENPFINDPFSQRGAGLIAGFKLHVDFGVTGGKVRTAQAEYMQVEEKKNYAERFIPLQVRKARAELEEAQKTIEATREGYLNARKWLVAAVANFDLGIGEAKDVADALASYARMRGDNFRAIYNYNMALANLDHATGHDLEQAAQ